MRKATVEWIDRCPAWIVEFVRSANDFLVRWFEVRSSAKNRAQPDHFDVSRNVEFAVRVVGFPVRFVDKSFSAIVRSAHKLERPVRSRTRTDCWTSIDESASRTARQFVNENKEGRFVVLNNVTFSNAELRRTNFVFCFLSFYYYWSELEPMRICATVQRRVCLGKDIGVKCWRLKKPIPTDKTVVSSNRVNHWIELVKFINVGVVESHTRRADRRETLERKSMGAMLSHEQVTSEDRTKILWWKGRKWIQVRRVRLVGPFTWTRKANGWNRSAPCSSIVSPMRERSFDRGEFVLSR